MCHPPPHSCVITTRPDTDANTNTTNETTLMKARVGGLLCVSEGTWELLQEGQKRRSHTREESVCVHRLRASSARVGSRSAHILLAVGVHSTSQKPCPR